MSEMDEDDKPTVVLDLNALKKQKLKAEEDLANLASEIEFNVLQDDLTEEVEEMEIICRVIYFDFQSDLFANSDLPQGFENIICTELKDLNKYLKTKDFQIVVFNYDSNPKAVNQLCLQIKQKLPSTHTVIVAKSISPQKAQMHAKTPSGAKGYISQPLTDDKLKSEFLRVFENKES